MIPFIGFDFLEVGCGDDRVDFEASREFEIISELVDFLDDQEWSKSFVFQLLGWLFGHQIFGIEPDFITNFKF